MKRALVAIVLVMAAAATAAAAGPYQETLHRINAQRQKHGLPSLKYNDKLATAAQSQADWMARTGKMVHLRGERPTTKEQWMRSHWHPINLVVQAGYHNFSILSKPDANDHAGEIIAHGNPGSGPGRFRPQVIVAGWMKSPGHRKAILTEGYQEMGVGLARTKQGDAYWCVVFGKG